MALETAITNSILKYLNSIDGCIAEKLKGGAESSGKPDISGCYKGCSFRIEVKTPDHKNRPTQKQMLNLLKWYRAGSVIMVAYSLDSVRFLIEKFDQINVRYSFPEDNKCVSSFIIPYKNLNVKNWDLVKAKKFWEELYGLRN